MKELLKSKVLEIEKEIEKRTERLDQLERNTKIFNNRYDYLDEFIEIYAQLNKLQYAQEILLELQEDVER